MPRLIWVFAGCTVSWFCHVMAQLMFYCTPVKRPLVNSVDQDQMLQNAVNPWFECNICTHKSFVTTAPPSLGNSGDYDYSSITAMLKTLHCGDKLKVTAPLFIPCSPNATAVTSFCKEITVLALPQHCGDDRKVNASYLSLVIHRSTPGFVVKLTSD